MNCMAGGPSQYYLCHNQNRISRSVGSQNNILVLVEQKASKTQPPTNGCLFLFLLLELD